MRRASQILVEEVFRLRVEVATAQRQVEPVLLERAINSMDVPVMPSGRSLPIVAVAENSGGSPSTNLKSGNSGGGPSVVGGGVDGADVIMVAPARSGAGRLPYRKARSGITFNGEDSNDVSGHAPSGGSNTYA
jgi:hypothetical protein